MTPRLRSIFFFIFACCLILPVWRIATALAPFGWPTESYGPAINTLGPPLRHVSNMVTAVNFDFRSFDTVGEEFMLLCAVTGAVLLLRGTRGESHTDRPTIVPGRALEHRSDSSILVCRIIGPTTLLFGIYMTLHATVTPGGGFQGGVIIASGLMLVYLGEGYRGWRSLIRSRVLESMEGGGALLFALAGVWSMFGGAAYMQNILALGKFKDMLSGGLMLVENAGVGIAVTAGFTMLFLEFMEETRSPKTDLEEGQ
jgi:multicomponent Na+:H+ antiporter subunit B